MALGTPDNEQIAEILERVATLLDLQKESRYRVRSYQRAAAAVRNAPQPLAEVLAGSGLEGLGDLLDVGPKLASVVEEIVETGQLRMLDRLEDQVSPEVPFVKVPGIDGELAARIHSVLGIESLEELEVAAHDGSLEQVDGIAPEQLRQIREALGRMLSRSARSRALQPPRRWDTRSRTVPPVDLLLAIDDEYRTKAEAGELRTIAPRRFNPEGEKWLPVMEVQRGEWAFSVLFSNTARAHELGTTRDWVVIYYKQRGRRDQCTVVTADRGPLAGRRVIRGREAECRDHYASDG